MRNKNPCKELEEFVNHVPPNIGFTVGDLSRIKMVISKLEKLIDECEEICHEPCPYAELINKAKELLEDLREKEKKLARYYEEEYETAYV